MTQQSVNNVNAEMINSASQFGMSQETVGLLINNLNVVTNAGAMGMGINDLAGDDVTLYCRIIDASGSMDDKVADLIAAANLQPDALAASKSGDSILMSTWIFNTRSSVLHSYLALDQVTRLDTQNYHPRGGTALFDTVLDAITSTVAYAQTLRMSGITVRVVFVVLSDGEDNESKHTAGQLRTVVEDLLNQEMYTISMVAFGFQGDQVAASIGVRPGNILNKNADAHGIRQGLDEISKSVISTSVSKIVSKNGFFAP